MSNNEKMPLNIKIKLSDVLEEYSERNTDNYKTVSVGKYGIRNREDIYSKELSQNIKNNKVIRKNTMTIGMGSKQIDLGFLLTDDVYSVSPAYHTFKIKNINPIYLKYYLDAVNKKLSVLYMVTGARQGKSVSINDFLNHQIGIHDIAIQQKIATFLKLLDELIALYEKKLELVKTYNKGLSQKLLSQQLRFKKSDGSSFQNWEEKILGDVLIQKIIKQIPTDKIPLMAFVAYKGVSKKGNRYDRSFLVKNINKKYKRTDYNDFIYSSNNLDVGSIGLNKYGSAVISDVYEIFKFKEGYVPDFVNALIQSPFILNQIIAFRQGCLYGQYKINACDFLSIKVNMPTFEEQQKIANILSSADETARSIEEKVQNLRTFKQGLLQQIFSN